jgi:hypothetical protein
MTHGAPYNGTMPSLSPGAVALPRHHLSVRVPWHDLDWTGRVCSAPGANHACRVLKNIAENKNDVVEEEHAGQAWIDLNAADVPPCALERGGFMRSAAFHLEREHPYAWRKGGSHGHFAPTIQHMPKFSLEATPFRWIRRDSYDDYARPWGISVDYSLEEAADAVMGWESGWIQDRRNQLSLLDSFFSALEPRRSLVLLYVKDLPLVEEPKAGERFLVGAGFVEHVSAAQEWEYSEEGPIRSVLWERGIGHSIRPGFSDGFLLPYQQLLRDPKLQGVDLAPFVARAPTDHFNEFSYVSELVPEDGAIGALIELGRVVELIAGVADGPWEGVSQWIGDRLAETWQARGPYPGLGPMLTAAGLERGTLLARGVLDDLNDDADPWTAISDAISANRDGLIGRPARKAWQALIADEARYRQLRVMSRFALGVDQARELFEELEPAAVFENPYVLYEEGRYCAEAPALTTIDRGMFPQDIASRDALAHDALLDPVQEAGDDRRVRAASVAVLEQAATEGHTVLDEPALRRRVSRLELTPVCDPVDALWAVAVPDFEPVLMRRPLAHSDGRAWQLDRLAEVSDVIASEVRSRADVPGLNVDWDWAERIADVIKGDASGHAEREARSEKAGALELIARRRICALIGPAGTGKTTMLEALCGDSEVKAGGILLLAPTGKAAVQLSARTGLKAQTLAQFLGRHQRWDYESGGYYLAPGAQRATGFKTVVIDEASMLTEEMLAAAVDALSGVERLILCGDPRQLPPIGAGRPFVDIVAFLRNGEHPGGAVAELRVVRRQTGPATVRNSAALDDVAVASLFSLDAAVPGAEEALARAVSGGGDSRVRVVTWNDESDLDRILVQELCGEAELDLASKTRGAICRSFGATCDNDGLPKFEWGSAGGGAERWQILSPVRDRPGGVTRLNQLVRRTWRGTDPSLALRSYKFTSPMGADGVIFADKVMCLRNAHRRGGVDPDGWVKHQDGVANGEIGMVVRSAKSSKNGRPTGHTIEFSTQPHRQYTFWDNELNSDADQEWLELAYAVTVHKAQGSQFRTTFVVIPDPCPLLSPELLYTALTRQQDRVVLLKQGSSANLRELGAPERSATARRLTCLFGPANPFVLGDVVLDGSHIHRTGRDELVRSKSEVIVADALAEALTPLGLDYGYELPLQFDDEFPRHPDFTIGRPGLPTVYWEHLGMLDLAGYRADWEARKDWYAQHEILPWTDGGGSRGTLVWSTEGLDGTGISSAAIRELAQQVFGS